ncbi:MAG TPA: amino acid adenylation domain-containing protein, partial [Mycobacteriales bacterium]|nr:amino acid adenylation domain-containing protein [Mycobacteriales bacterium]
MADLTARLAALSPEQRAAVVAKLAARTAARSGAGAIPVRPDGEPARASYLQERLWLVDQWDHDGAAAYNLPTAFRLRGPLDTDRLARALTAVVARHEALRTVFTARDGVPYQVVTPARPVDLPVEDRSHLPAASRLSAVLAEAAADAAVPFDLERGPLIRMWLFRLAERDHVLAMPAAHLCTDGWSVSLMVAELAELYRADAQGHEPVLPDLPVQYSDVAAWQRSAAGAGELERHLRYWQDTLAGAPVLDLPTDRPRPPRQSHRGATIEHRIPLELADRLRGLARDHDVTPFMVLTAAMTLLLCRYTGQEDIVTGTASAGRDHPQVEKLIGFFTNMVVLRNDLSGNPTFAELLARTRAVTVEAFDHQSAPYDQVVERLNPPRDLSRNPLFQVAMDLQPGGFGFTLPGVQAELVGLEQGTARFDIAINVFEESDGLLVSAEYATDLFDHARMERMLGHFEQVLAAVVADPSVRLSRVRLLSPAERDQVLARWQGEVRDYPREPVHVQFARQARRDPDAVALVYRGKSVTYGELAGRAGLLARYLRSVGTGPGDVVGIGLERDPDTIVAILGVLMAGAAFVPLDLEDPAARTGFTLADTGARVVLTRSDLAGMLPADLRCDLIAVDRIQADAQALAGTELPEWSSSASPAYVLYTSGSTGVPKGAVIAQHAIATYVEFLRTVFRFGRPGSRVLQYTALIFDLAEGEIFAALSSGATLVLVPRETTLSAEQMSALLRAERVTYLGGPPAMVELLDAGAYPDLRGMLVGGEAFSGDLVNRWNTDGRLFLNAYGPTEATIGCTYYRCPQRRWTASPPIGRPMPQRRVYLVDRWFNPVPVGVPGEILAAGEGLADGYVNRPGLTAQKFVPDPFGHGRAYRTGDLAYWTEDGQIQFVGRIDTQIQLRGMRIELSEVEAAVDSHPGVERSVVALREDTPGEPRLVAYVIGAGVNSGVDPAGTAGLREHVASRLPVYMVPSVFVPVESFPLSPTGKVDRPKLPPPDPGRQASSYLTPRTGTERRVAEAFGEVLALPRVGATDNFFDLGGNSLQAARVVARIRAELGVGLAVRDFFTSPVVADLARSVDQGLAAAGEPVARSQGGPAGQPGPGDTRAGLAAEIEELERRLREARQRLEDTPDTPDTPAAANTPDTPGPAVVAVERPLVARPAGTGTVPLSFQQEQLWFMDRLVPGLSAYNVPLSLRLVGPLDAGQVRSALSAVVARHEALRTTVAVRDGVPVGVVAPAGEVELPVVEVPVGADVNVLADTETARRFDLHRGPLLRARLFRVDPVDHLLTVTVHHIVSDGWSTAALLAELAELLGAAIQGRAPELAELPVQYGDYATWQRARLTGDTLAGHLDFWQATLAGAPTLELPGDRPRPAEPTYRGDVVHRALPAALLDGLRELSRSAGVSLFMTLLAAFDTLLTRYTGQYDVVVGTPVAGRDRPELEPLIGLFTNMVVLRTDLSGDPTFGEVLARVRDTTLDAYEHQDVPFEQVVARLAPRREAGRNPLFQVMFGLLPGQVGGARVGVPGLDARIGTPAQGTSRFDLTVNVSESPGELSVAAEYASDLFDRDRVERMLDHLERLLAAVVADPS